MMKLIPYFQYVPTMSYLMVVWHKLYKPSNQFFISNIFHDLSYQHNKNNWNIRMPMALNQSSKRSKYVSYVTKGSFNCFFLKNKSFIIHKGAHLSGTKVKIMITLNIINTKTLSHPWWHWQWNYRDVGGNLNIQLVDGKYLWVKDQIAWEWNSLLAYIKLWFSNHL